LNGVLSNRDHELLALRAAHNCHSKFEWDEHSEYARGAGLTDGEIAAVAAPLSDGGWSASERALLQAADDLHATQDVAEETWGVLASYYDTPALAEIPFVVGQYTMLSRWSRTRRGSTGSRYFRRSSMMRLNRSHVSLAGICAFPGRQSIPP
jgi:alkylhydroperoxidase family enzyme